LDVDVVPLVLRLRSDAVGVCGGKVVVRVRDKRRLDLSESSDESEYGTYFTHSYASAQQKRSADAGD
jgi:hypothetical protein